MFGLPSSLRMTLAMFVTACCCALALSQSAFAMQWSFTEAGGTITCSREGTATASDKITAALYEQWNGNRVDDPASYAVQTRLLKNLSGDLSALSFAGIGAGRVLVQITQGDIWSWGALDIPAAPVEATEVTPVSVVTWSAPETVTVPVAETPQEDRDLAVIGTALTAGSLLALLGFQIGRG